MRKNARQTITIKCSFCGNDVKKFKKEYDRQIRRGKIKFYCNLSCSAQNNPSLVAQCLYNKSHPKEASERLQLFNKYQGRGPDEYSLFKSYIHKINRRTKRWDKNCIVSITPEYIKSLWESQKGICPYTGIKMELRKYSCPSNLYSASIDRIDSSKPYIEGNIEFVCLGINYAKNSFSKQEMLDFIKKIKNI